MTKVVTKLLSITVIMLCALQTAYGASKPQAYASSWVDAKCAASNDGSAVITISGGQKFDTGYPYAVTLMRNNEICIQAEYTFTEQASGLTKLDIANLQAGYYSITLKDANDESANATFTISSPGAIVVTLTQTVDIVCTGESTGGAALVITGGKEPYSVVCKDAVTLEDAGTVTVINNNVKVTALPLGNYNIEVTDINGCSPATSTSFEIKSPYAPLAYTPSSNNVTCFGGSTGKIFGEAQGGKLPFTYTITNNTTPYTAGNNTGTFTGLPTGNYTAVAADANGCTVTVTDVIVDTPEEITVQDPTAKPAATVVCAEHKTASIKFTVKGRIEPVAPADTAIYYAVKLFSITDQHEVAVTDFKSSNTFHPVFRQPVYCDSIHYIKDPETGEVIEEKIVHYVCGIDTIFEKGCHEPTKDRGSLEYPVDSLGYDCDDYITVSNLGKGAYRIEFYRGECQIGAYKEFTVEQTGGVPEAVKINALEPICDGSEYTVTPEIVANPGIRSYKWTLGGIDAGTGSTFKHTYISAEDKSILQLEATNQCGSTKSNEAQITVLPRPTATLMTSSAFLCEGDETDIAIVFKGTAPFTYKLTGSEEASTMNASEKVKVTPTATTTYTLTSLSDANCVANVATDVTSTLVTVYPKSQGSLTLDIPEPMVSGRYVTITATPGFVSYALQMNGEDVEAAGPANVFKVKKFPYGTSTNTFSLTAIDSNGCPWSDETTAVIKEETFPNIFTPNGDGVNDIFLEGYDIEVFDRWGTVMFTGTSGWDGKHNGVFVNPGVYLYVVKIADQSGEQIIIKKTVTVER